MNSVRLRIEYVIATYSRELTVALVVIAILSTILTGSALFAPQESKQVTQQVNKQTGTVTLNAGATVTEDSSLYRSGRQLRNQEVYFLTATPTVNISVETSINDAERTSVTQQIAIVIVGTANGNTIYRNVDILAQETKTTNGENVVTTAKLSVPEFQRNQLNPLRQETGSAASFQTRVRVKSAYDTPKYNDTLTISQPLSISSNAYTFETPKSTKRTHSESVTKQVSQPASPSPPVWVRATVALVAILGAYFLHRSDTSTRSPKHIKESLERKRYAEWISSGTIPKDTDVRTVKVDSVKDIVETGIDIGGRVIHDESASTFAVIDGETIYQYSYSRTDGQIKNGHPSEYIEFDSSFEWQDTSGSENSFNWQGTRENRSSFDRQPGTDRKSHTRNWIASVKRWPQKIVPWTIDSGTRNRSQAESTTDGERDSSVNGDQPKEPRK